MAAVELGHWQRAAAARLAGRSENPRLEARVLLGQVLAKPPAWLSAHPEAELAAEQLQRLDELLARLEAGEPLPYVLGHWEFYGLDFTVTPATLIPRPETELLVETALAWLRAHSGPRRAADVGSGSGCIAVSLAKHTPALQVLAVDLSYLALQVTQANARRHGVAGRVSCVQADLLSAVGGQLDLICANLPYIPSAALQDLAVARYEPRGALDGGPDGLDVIRRLLEQSAGRLAAGGLLLLEIEAGQGAEAGALARQTYPGGRVAVLPDLAGHDRLVRVQV